MSKKYLDKAGLDQLVTQIKNYIITEINKIEIGGIDLTGYATTQYVDNGLDDVSSDIYQMHGLIDQIVSQIHLPITSGSNGRAFTSTSYGLSVYVRDVTIDLSNTSRQEFDMPTSFGSSQIVWVGLSPHYSAIVGTGFTQRYTSLKDTIVTKHGTANKWVVLNRTTTSDTATVTLIAIGV